MMPPINERHEEFLWLANESGPYAGQWVALDGNRRAFSPQRER